MGIVYLKTVVAAAQNKTSYGHIKIITIFEQLFTKCLNLVVELDLVRLYDQ